MRRLATGGLCVAVSALLGSGCYSGLDGGRGGDGGGLDGDDDAGDGDGDGDGEDGDGDGGDDGAPADFEPTPVSLRLLLSHQYTAAIGTLLGDAAAEAATPPGDTAINGFTAIGAAQLALNDSAIDAYEDSARAVADVAWDDPANADLVPCTPAGTADAACMEAFVVDFGRLAFRRPLADEEVEQWVAVGLTAAGDFEEFGAGARAVISGMLQSPFFLYQVEVGEPDADNPGRRRLTGLEMATRLSFFVLGTTPDAALLDAAEAGELDDAAGVRAAAEAMLALPQARDALARFASELYRLRELDTVPKDTTEFPTFSAALAASMKQETLALLDHVVFEQQGDFLDVLDAPYTFVDATLAQHYGIAGTFGDAPTMVDVPAGQKRGGLLGHAGLLSILAHVTSTSPTLRGKFVRETLMCQSIPAPPPDVATDLPEGETQTLRERLEQHMVDPSCAGCHVLMDPIGFGLESYDGIGAFRTLENGVPVDDASELNEVQFAGSAELGAILRDDPLVPHCTIRNLYRHATGHLENVDELHELEEVTAAFVESGHRLDDAIVALVGSSTFRLVGEPE